MFVVYKLKVAAAEAAGLDTTATFRSEFDGYCADLSTPYLKDKAVEAKLLDQAYDRARSRRRVSHILMEPGRTPSHDKEVRARLDSIRSAIASGADFGEMARKYSIDRSAQVNGGDLGYIRAGQFPILFEEAAFATPVGEVSGIVEDIPYGYHLIKVVDERPEEGEVSARHILKLTQGLEPAEAALKKTEIDSIARLLAAGADFETRAREESEDPGSAARGGNLGFFGSGGMVPEFEDAAYSLKPGEISAPFPTAYGWHIVQTLEYKPFPPKEEIKDQLLAAMEHDGRSLRPRQAYLASFRDRLGARVDEAVVEKALEGISDITDTSKALEQLKANKSVVADIAGDKLIVADIASVINPGIDPERISMVFGMVLKDKLDEVTLNAARKDLAANNEEYRNLANEYRDGILLFEVANRNVWARAAEDVEVQKAYFAEHRDKYTWDRPRFKGCVVFAVNDSVAAEARKYLDQNPMALDTIASNVLKHFDGEVKLERVLVAKGENPIIDELAFGGAKAKPVGRWNTWFAYDSRVLEAPEEAADVKAAVIGDLQQELEASWVESLRKDYPVKINKKVLKKLSQK
ncbi:MAG: peptidyl-prolyl cis-trans isomerase [Duncaniella sp.]|nr:peptidyl-prolyl cis-trans isomerase [Duncaniella sp.]